MTLDYITPITTLLSAIGVIGSIFYLHGLMRQEYIKSDDRWATLKSESDDRFVDMQEKWVETQREILKISQRVERLENKAVN